MPRYNIGSQGYYSQGVLYVAGSEVELQDDVEPGKDWTALDDAGEKALKKLKERNEARAAVEADKKLKVLDDPAIRAYLEATIDRRVSERVAAATKQPAPKAPEAPREKGAKRAADQDPT